MLGRRVLEESIFEKAFAGVDALSMQRHIKHAKIFACNSGRTRSCNECVKFKTIRKIFSILTMASQELNRSDLQQELDLQKNLLDSKIK
jgi:hypothetical protein